MKKLSIFTFFAISMIFLLSSCSKEDGISQNGSKTYSVTYNGHYSSAAIDIFEFDINGDPIHHVSGKFYQGKMRCNGQKLG